LSAVIRGLLVNVTGSCEAFQQPPMKQPTVPAPRIATLSAATIWLYALVGQPQARRRGTALPEDVDGHAAARIPIAADAQPPRLHLLCQALADADGDVLVETLMVAVGAEEQLQTLRFDDCLARRIVDHQMCEVGLPRNRA